MKIDLPGLAEQRKFIFEESTKAAIAQLKKNMKAEVLPPQSELDESKYPNTHLLRDTDGFEAPHPDIVGAYFRHFQSHFPEYDTDKKLGVLIGVNSNHSDRRVREFKSGATKVPYGIWRRFLVLTGRVPQDVLPILAFMG